MADSLSSFSSYQLREAAKSEWSKVRPEIFGTLFEHSLDHEERHALGAHYTAPVDIRKIIGPTIVEPWREQIENAKTRDRLRELLERLQHFMVLDPAFGSGNFLYLAYREMKRLEARIFERVKEEFPAKGKRKAAPTARAFGFVTARQFYGLDISPFAVELAKVTMMIARKLTLDDAVLAAYGFSPKTDLLAQLLDLNHTVAIRITRHKPVTSSGISPNYPHPESLITADCISP